MCDVAHTSPVEQVRDILGRLCEFEPNSSEVLLALLTSCTTDVVLDTRFGLADGQLYRGRKGVEQFFREWLSSWEEWSWTPVDIFDTPNGVVVTVEERATQRGLHVSQRHVQNWRLRDGLICAWTIYTAEFRPDFSVRKLEAVA